MRTPFYPAIVDRDAWPVAVALPKAVEPSQSKKATQKMGYFVPKWIFRSAHLNVTSHLIDVMPVG